MPTYVRVRGLARKGVRLRTSLAASGGNAVTLTGTTAVIVDLDDPKTRADVAHHSSIGQIQVIDYVSKVASVAASSGAVQSGCVVTPRFSSLVADVSAGVFVWNDAATLRTVTVTAQTVTFGANATGNNRTDFVVLTPVAGGVTYGITVLAGGTTFPWGEPATPAAPAVVLAKAVIAPNGTQPLSVLDTRPLA
jgi:hypothetical protein